MEIKKGDIGNAVVDIQQRLLGLGHELGSTGVDGFFGGRTQRAVKEFQVKNVLEPSGVVDEQTWRRMVDATYKLGDRALYLRSPFFHGDDIRQLQLWLNHIGFHHEHPDGIFGPSTESAVKEFQENLDLSVDGIVGPSTLGALNNIKGVINDTQNPVTFGDRPDDSVVSLLTGRTIAVGCVTPHKRYWLSPTGHNQLLCADLSHRLSNLLEVLGAQTSFFKLRPEPRIDGEIAVVFRPGLEEIPADCVGVKFTPGSAQSRKLAELVGSALRASLKQRVDNVLIEEGASYDRPAVEITPGTLTYLIDNPSVGNDVFKQKIAGAVFDGLKSFFELAD